MTFENRYGKAIHFLMENGASSIHYRTATELYDNFDVYATEKYKLEIIRSERFNKLMHCLKNRKEYHGGTVYAAENSLNMLVDMGIQYNNGFPEFDETLEQIANELKTLYLDENDVFRIFYQIIMVPFLYRTGLKQDWITDFIKNRIQLIHSFTKLQNYDIYDDPSLHRSIPAAYQGRPVIKPELYTNGNIQFPLEYDIYGFGAIWNDLDIEMKNKVNEIVSYIMDERFQSIHSGYGILHKGGNSYISMGWDPKPTDLSKTYKVNPLLQKLELLSHFQSAVNSMWFQQAIGILTQYADRHTGVYALPKEYLTEKDSVWVLGNHMSLGENRRSKKAHLIEGTFHMLKIQRQIETFTCSENK